MGNNHRWLRALAQKLELPSELLFGDPGIELSGRSALTVHRHRGIAAYEADCVRILSSLGMLRVRGSGLQILRMNRESIVLLGRIDELCFEGETG